MARVHKDQDTVAAAAGVAAVADVVVVAAKEDIHQLLKKSS